MSERRADKRTETAINRVKTIVSSMHAEAAEVGRIDRDVAALVRKAADDLSDAAERFARKQDQRGDG